MMKKTKLIMWKLSYIWNEIQLSLNSIQIQLKKNGMQIDAQILKTCLSFPSFVTMVLGKNNFKQNPSHFIQILF
jgi:hypothetical protein